MKIKRGKMGKIKSFIIELGDDLGERVWVLFCSFMAVMLLYGLFFIIGGRT